MNVTYLDDSDLHFLQFCSEEQLEGFTRLLTHNSKDKPRLSSVLLRNEYYLSMEGHPERHRRSWQLIAGELQHFGGDSIANRLRGHGKRYRAILLDVCHRLRMKVDKTLPTVEIEQSLLEHFLRHAWKKMDDEQKALFFAAAEVDASKLDDILPLQLEDQKLIAGISLLLSGKLNRILHNHAAISVTGHGLLSGPVSTAFNSLKAVSGTAWRVTIPAVLRIACLRRLIAVQHS